MDTMINMVEDEHATLPHVQQLVAAYNVGKMTKNPKLCKWLFPCAESQQEARFVTCNQISKLCPGVSLSCGLCAVISPESCSVVCPVGAIYCGTASYACALEAAQESAAAVEASEAEVPEEEEPAEPENVTPAPPAPIPTGPTPLPDE